MKTGTPPPPLSLFSSCHCKACITCYVFINTCTHSRHSSPSRQDPRAAAPQAATEPNIDLVMDLKVTIQSGQLILHPDAPSNPDDSNTKDRAK